MTVCVHGDNLTQKQKHKTKYRSKKCKQYLTQIRRKYNAWHNANTRLIGPSSEIKGNTTKIIEQRIALLTAYKDFIDQQKYAEAFDSRSNLHSTVLEEFIYYLFKDFVKDFSQEALIGKAHTFKDIFFMPPNYKSMVDKPYAHIETKNHDFIIGVNISTRFSVEGSDDHQDVTLQIPAVAIECKTYLDKAMLEGASTAAAQLKNRNPNALYIVVAEWLKLTESVNLQKYKVDQIYILRKQKNTDREFRFLDGYKKNPIYPEVVEHLFNYVFNYLISDWEGGVKFGLDRGYLL